MNDTPSDRDALRKAIEWHRTEVMAGTTTLTLADAILASDWLAVHDRDVTGRAHAPIKALAERADVGVKAGTGLVTTADLRAALDPAAVEAYEQRIRAEERERLADMIADNAATAARFAKDKRSVALVIAESLRSDARSLRDRADALGQEDGR